jgi:hypothetical protein
MVLQILINLSSWVPLAKPEGLASARASFASPVAPGSLNFAKPSLRPGVEGLRVIPLGAGLARTTQKGEKNDRAFADLQVRGMREHRGAAS